MEVDTQRFERSQVEVESEEKENTVAEVFFQSESHQREEQATVVCHGGCLRQFIQEKT